MPEPTCLATISAPSSAPHWITIPGVGGVYVSEQPSKRLRLTHGRVFELRNDLGLTVDVVEGDDPLELAKAAAAAKAKLAEPACAPQPQAGKAPKK